jgi:hypothetical protein
VTAIRGGATVTWHLVTQTIAETRITNNVIADSPFGGRVAELGPAGVRR